MGRRGGNWGRRLVLTVLAGGVAAATITVLPSGAGAVAFTDWSGPTGLTVNQYEANYAKLGLSSDGTVAVAMWDRNSGIELATAAIAGDTATWSSAQVLSTSGDSDGSVALSANGDVAVAVWEDYVPSTRLVAAVATVSGGVATWSTPVALDTEGSEPLVAVSSDGTKATVMWDKSDDLYGVSATIAGNVATWGTPARVSDNTRKVDKFEFALSANGTRATAIWTYDIPGGYLIQANSAAISGTTQTWGTTTALTSEPSVGSDARVAISADGTKVVGLWLNKPGSVYVVQTAVATLSNEVATWGSVQTITSDDGRRSNYPDVAISSDGATVVGSWQRQETPGGDYIIESAVATTSGTTATWGSAVAVSATGGTAFDANLALTPDGTKAALSWYRMNTTYIIQAAVGTVARTSATWGTPANLSAVGSWSFYPKIALSSSGGAGSAIWVADGIVQTSSTGNAVTAPDIGLNLNLSVGDNIRTDALTVTTSGSGLGSSVPYTVVMQSSPVQIGQGTTTAQGTFTDTSPLPTGTEAGSHSVTVTSKDPSENTVTAVGYFSVNSSGVVTAVSYDGPTPPPELPPTGTSTAPIVALSLALLAAGATLNTLQRRLRRH